MTDRIDSNDLGVDDVVLNNVTTFHLKRMSDTTFWLCCNQGDERTVFWANAVDGKIIIRKGAE